MHTQAAKRQWSALGGPMYSLKLGGIAQWLQEQTPEGTEEGRDGLLEPGEGQPASGRWPTHLPWSPFIPWA